MLGGFHNLSEALFCRKEGGLGMWEAQRWEWMPPLDKPTRAGGWAKWVGRRMGSRLLGEQNDGQVDVAGWIGKWGCH